MTSINTQAAQARESARSSDGKFGHQEHDRADDIDLSAGGQRLTYLNLEALTSRRGIFESGYTPDDIEVLNGELNDRDGIRIVARWEYEDEYGLGGDSELLITDANDRPFTHMPADMFEHLTDPGSDVDLAGIDPASGEGARELWSSAEGYEHSIVRVAQTPQPSLDERFSARAAEANEAFVRYEKLSVEVNEMSIEKLSHIATEVAPANAVAVGVAAEPDGDPERPEDSLRGLRWIHADGSVHAIDDRGAEELLYDRWCDVDRNMLRDNSHAGLIAPRDTELPSDEMSAGRVERIIPIRGRAHGMDEPASWS